MGLFKFRLPGEMPRRSIAKAYLTGMDRAATRISTTVEGTTLGVRREGSESGRFCLPWPIEGFGSAFVGTATLGERPEPFDLAVELARGKLNDVRNQLADWKSMGLRTGPSFEAQLGEAQRAFTRAVTSRDRPAEALVSARACIQASWAAGQALVDHYVQQVIQTRLSGGTKLPTQLGIALESEPKKPWSAEIRPTFNAARLAATWRTISPTEGQNRYETLDAQLAWASKHKLALQGGPIVDLRSGAMPDWLCLWEGDYDAIQGMAVDLVRQTIGRYKGKVPVWTLLHRPGSADALKLGEEDQIRLCARLLQVARHVDPSAQYVIGIDRPWGDWVAKTKFQLGPLHLADYLARSDLGLSGIAIEIAPGYHPIGSGLRDVFEFSRLLDTYAQINLPLFVSIAVPSSTASDPLADPNVVVDPGEWPADLDEAGQAHWAAGYIALAVAKPFVRSVTWSQLSDGLPHLYPNAGLLRADHSPKPLVEWLRGFRKDLLI